MNGIALWGDTDIPVRITAKTERRCEIKDGRIISVKCTKCGDHFNPHSKLSPQARKFTDRPADWHYLDGKCRICRGEAEAASREKHGKAYVRKTEDQKTELREDGRYWQCRICKQMVFEGDMFPSSKGPNKRGSPGQNCRVCYRKRHNSYYWRRKGLRRKNGEVLNQNKDNSGPQRSGSQEAVPELQKVP